ncbi:hypothetical protein [Streptomyces sp. NPDC004250]|uniref:hypothetical protein n=1 Tax=Streptomyces sp. NPDC004250 TaxID=3364692 RepID=UPI00367B6945
MSEQSPELAAYAQAAQTCRDIAQQVGVRNCDDDPNWRAAEALANTRFDEARAAGHSQDEVLKAGRGA